MGKIINFNINLLLTCVGTRFFGYSSLFFIYFTYLTNFLKKKNFYCIVQIATALQQGTDLPSTFITKLNLNKNTNFCFLKC